LIKASYRGRPISEIAFSSRFLASVAAYSPACSAISRRAWSGEYAASKNWLMVPRLIGIGKTCPRKFV
jgi:hypothetical protein